jgi:DNA-nicking Smr family endonuclease
MAKLGRLVNDGIEFNLEFTEEYMHGKVKDLDSHVFQKLKNGRLSCEAHIDLHGLTAEQAGFALIDFIRDQYLKGSRCVLVVHGRGMNSPAGRSVLKHEVQRWLTRDPLRRVVLAFVTAMPRHGGAGAIYVLLRKYKKNGGKVLWDRLPPDLSYTS